MKDQSHIEIPLRGSKFPGLVAIVDPEDADLVNQAAWRAVVTQPRSQAQGKTQIAKYASARQRPNTYEGFPEYLYLHRLVMGVTDRALQVDHINHNGLDCRKSNLRVVTHQQNHFNRRPHANSTSEFKGVAWGKSTGKWRATICHNSRHTILGEFTSEIDAAVAYDNAAMEMFGEFAYLNFPVKDVK